MGILDQAKTEMQPRPGALFGLFNKHEQLTPEQVDRRYKQGAVLSALGMGLSQLGAGQPVNMSPAFEGLQKRQQQAQLRKVMEQPGLMDGFSPQQRAILATMPESMAVELIMQRAFAPPPDPTRGIEINDQLVNPITGESMGDYRTPETTDRKTAQDINGVLRYVDTGEPVFPNVAAEPPTPKQTDDMAEYAAAVQQGYTGTLADWILEQRRAGASKTDITVSPAGDPVNSDYTKKRNEGYAARMQEIETQEAAAQRALSSLEVMKQQMADPNFYSGSGADAVLALRRAGAALGVADPAGIDSMETFNAQAKAAALDVMGGSLGTGFSNADRDFVEQQVPNLQSTPQGNAKLIDVQKAIQERKLEIAKRARKYESEHGQIDQGFFTELQQWADANPIFRAEPAATGTAPIVVDGYTIQQVD